MSTAKKYFEEILESLLYQCLAGDANYRLWKKLDEALSKFPNLNEEYSTYFRITKEGYYELFFFNLCRLIDTSGQAINVEKGLMYSKEYLGIFEFQDKKNMEKIIDEDIKSLKKEKSLIDKILGQRNNYYAHLAKKYLSSFHDKVFEDFHAPNEEMYRLLKKIMDILNHLNKNFRRDERMLGIYNEKQIECADQLSGLIEKLNEALEST